MKASIDKPAFGQDRIVKIVSDTKLSEKLEKYLETIKKQPEQMGQKLKKYIARIGVDVQQLTLESLQQYILRTKEPVIFGEQHVKGDGSDWNTTELDILGDISFITEVKVYDNGASGSKNSALKIEQYKEPYTTQFLISVSGPIFKAGTPDYADVVDASGEISYAKYYQKIEKLLLPALLAQNAICLDKELDGIITLPGIGCGEFAGEFRGIMGIFLNAAVKDLLTKHSESLRGIKGIVLDTFAECKSEVADFGHIKYVVAPSGLVDDTNSDHHLERNGKKLYLSQLARPAEVVEFFKALDLVLNEDKILCISGVAGDKFSQNGNDAIAGYRTTDEGRKAAGTDLMAVHSREEGYYDRSNEESPRYRSFAPGDQGYGYAFIENRDKLLTITDETRCQMECAYTEALDLQFDPKISTSFYIKLCQIYKGQGKKQHEIVEDVKKCGVSYQETLSKLLSGKAKTLEAYKLQDGVLRGETGGEDMYKDLADLFIDQLPSTVQDVANKLSANNGDIYSKIAKSTLSWSYPVELAEALKFNKSRQTNDLQTEFHYDLAKAFTHDILANHTITQDVDVYDFVLLCFGVKEGSVGLGKKFISNTNVISSKLGSWPPQDKAQLLLFFMYYCKCAVVEKIKGEVQINQMKDLGSIKSALDRLDGDFVILDVTVDGEKSCTIKMIAPDEVRPGQSKYVEMSFAKAEKGLEVTTKEYGHDTKEIAHNYIAEQVLGEIKQVIDPTVKKENTDELLKAILENADKGNTVMPNKRLETAKNNFKQRALPKLLDLYTEQDTGGQFKSYSELDSGTQIHTRIRSKVEAKIDGWLKKPKQYWSLCYATAVEGFKVKPASTEKPTSRLREGPKKQETSIIKKAQQKDEMLPVNAYRRELSMRSLIQDAGINEYLKKIQKNSANNYASWFKAMGIIEIEYITVKENLESVQKAKLKFKNQKSRNVFYKELGIALGVEKQSLDKENGIVLDLDQLEVIRHIYKKTNKSVNVHHKMYIMPALRMIKEDVLKNEVEEGIEKPVINTRFAYNKSSYDNSFWDDYLEKAIKSLKTPQSKHIAFSSCLEAMELCILSYIALNHELMPSEWILKLGDLCRVLRSSYDPKPKINNTDELRNVLNEGLPSGQKLIPLKDEQNDMISVFNLVIDYCKALNLPMIDFMRADMFFAFGQYADIKELSKTLNAANKAISDSAFKEAVGQLVAQADAVPIKKNEDAKTIKVRQYEKTSYQYMHVDEKGELVMMLPFTGGGTISTDNTCKARLAIDGFCANIKGVISRYIEDLEKDIALIKEQQVLEKKRGRLATLKVWQTSFNSNPLNSNALIQSVQNKLSASNAVSTAHLVEFPDSIRGFRCNHTRTNPLTNKLSERQYDAMFTDRRIVTELLPGLKNTKHNYKGCNYKVIFDLAIDKYKSKSEYSDAKAMSLEDKELESFEWLAKCIEKAVQEKIDSAFKLKIEDIIGGGSLLSKEGLAAYRVDAWMLEEDEACDFDSAFNSLLSPSEWEKLEGQIQDKAFYTNRTAHTFMVMAQVFVTSLTPIYFKDNGVKVDFAEFIEQPANLGRFFDIVSKCFETGESFVGPILKDIINPALEKKIDIDEAAKRFKEKVFTTINGSDHYDEFLQLPDEFVEDDNTRVHFYIFGGSMSLSLEELEWNGRPYKQFIHKDDISISVRNKIGDYSFELNIEENINSKKTPQEIAQFLTLKIPGSSEDKEEYVYSVLPNKVAQQIQQRKDFADIRKHLMQKLGQGSYAKLAKSWGMTNCLYITQELELKIYMLYATKCENEWLYDTTKTKTLAVLSGKSRGNRLVHMLSKLDIPVVDDGDGLLRNDDNSAYIIECEENKATTLIKQFIGISNTLYIRTELAESCYKRVQSDINEYNNKGVPGDESKIIVTLRRLFSSHDIRPDVRPHNEGYNPNVVLVSFCEDKGYVFKCHNHETLSSVYETINIYHAEACKISVSRDAMLLFIRKRLQANSEVSVANAEAAFKKANIYYMGEITNSPDDNFIVSLDKVSQEAFFGEVLTFMLDRDALGERGMLDKAIANHMSLPSNIPIDAKTEVEFAGQFVECKRVLNGAITNLINGRTDFAALQNLKLHYNKKDFDSLNKQLQLAEKDLLSLNSAINMAPILFDGLNDLRDRLQNICANVRSKEKSIKISPDDTRGLQYGGYGLLAGVALSAGLCYSGKLPFNLLATSSLYNMTYLLKPVSIAIIASGGIVGSVIAMLTEKSIEAHFTELTS